MNIKFRHVLIILLCLCIFGCGYKEGIVQTSPKSYLWFTGKTADAIVYINDLRPFSLNKPINEDPSRPQNELTHYQLQPGKYNIIVKKNDSVVVNRVVILGEGMTTEIEIP
jgi:hypothetical protein